MALLTTFDFETQTPDDPISASGITNWSTIGTGTATATEASAVHGDIGGHFGDGSASIALQYTSIPSGDVVTDFYFRVHDASANLNIATARSSGTTAATLRRVPGGSLVLRDGSSDAWTSTTPIAANGTLYRVAWKQSTAGQEVRLYLGESTTPVEQTSTPAALTVTAIDQIRVGMTGASTDADLDVDTIRVAQEWLDPIDPEEPPAETVFAWHAYSGAGARIPLNTHVYAPNGDRVAVDVAAPEGEPPAPPSEGLSTLLLHGGGTHNHIAHSPNGNYIIASADIGGTRWHDGDDWYHLPSRTDPASRQVGGAAITNDGTVYQVVGNGPGGALQRINTDGTIDVLISGLTVQANSFSTGDAGPRPRPVGWMVATNADQSVVWACTEDGVARWTSGGGSDGIVALSGQSCRGFAHTHTTIGSHTTLDVCTRTNGIQRLSNITGSVSATSFGTVTRAEDAAPTPGGGLLVAGHTAGVFHIAANGTTTNVTPSGSSTGSNGSAVRWLAVAVASDGTAAAGMVNPTGANNWIYRAFDADNPTWTAVTTGSTTQEPGSNYLRPANRVLGASAGSGPNLTGTWGIIFHPTNTDQVTTAGTLSLYRCNNFGAGTPTWSTFNHDLSMLSVTDCAVSDDGAAVITCADHTSFAAAPGSVLDTEPTWRSISGVSDAWGVDSCGTGANTLWVLAPSDDKASDSGTHDVSFYRGTGAPTGWTTTGWKAQMGGYGSLSSGQVPRVGGVYCFDRGNGTYRAVVWADHVGWAYADYTLSNNTWSSWSVATGPGSNLVTSNQNQTRAICGTADGSLLAAIQLTNGTLWISTNEGATWTNIAGQIGTSQQVRTGRVAIHPEGDWLIVSDGTGLWRVTNPTSTPTVVKISGISNPCIVTVTANGDALAWVRDPVGRLLRFPDFATATADSHATDISGPILSRRWADGVTQMRAVTIDGQEYALMTWQGAGIAAFPLEEEE